MVQQISMARSLRKSKVTSQLLLIQHTTKQHYQVDTQVGLPAPLLSLPHLKCMQNSAMMMWGLPSPHTDW